MKQLQLLFFALLFTVVGSAQVSGFWKVIKVMVGDQEMTPVAKWFDLQSGTVESGNGGVINIRGSYQLNDKQLLFTNEAGEADPFGSFQVSFTDKDQSTNSMIWQRKEGDRMVNVFLRKVKARPLAPWDQLVGNWTVTAFSESETELPAMISSLKDNTFFFRWDRIFIQNGHPVVEGNHTGIWQIHGHRPELRLLSNQGDDNDQRWQIEFKDEATMEWSSPGTAGKIILKRQ